MLSLPQSLYDAMIEHCRRGLPNEACGFIAGRDGKGERIYPLTNSAASPVYYVPDGREMLAAMKSIEEQGLELSAIFHSHVESPPNPSPTDVREAHYPDTVYLIVSLADPEDAEVRGWFIRKADWRDEDGEVEEVQLVLS